MTVTKQMFKDNVHKVSVNLIISLAYSESSFNPEAVSDAGAVGLMQFMPSTWSEFAPHDADRKDPVESIKAADSYMRWLLNQLDNNIYYALIAYMWGIGNVLEKGILEAPEFVQDRAAMIQFMMDFLWQWDLLPDA